MTGLTALGVPFSPPGIKAALVPDLHRECSTDVFAEADAHLPCSALSALEVLLGQSHVRRDHRHWAEPLMEGPLPVQVFP